MIMLPSSNMVGVLLLLIKRNAHPDRQISYKDFFVKGAPPSSVAVLENNLLIFNKYDI